MKNYTITFDSWYTERKISNDGRELQVDIGSAQHINSPKYVIGVFQTQNRIGVPDKANNFAFFDTNHVTKYFVETDGARYPRDGVSTIFFKKMIFKSIWRFQIILQKNMLVSNY